MNLRERIENLANHLEALVIHWEKRDPKESTNWSSKVTVGLWVMAAATLAREPNGTLIIRCSSLSLFRSDRRLLVQDEKASGRTTPGEMSMDAQNVVQTLIECAKQAEEILRYYLIESSREAMAVGMTPEEIIACAREAVIGEVMES